METMFEDARIQHFERITVKGEIQDKLALHEAVRKKGYTIVTSRLDGAFNFVVVGEKEIKNGSGD